MKKSLLLVAALVFVSWSQAQADYSFNFGGSALATNGNSYSYDFSGDLTSLTTTPDANGYVVVTGGSLTSTGTAYNGIVFNVSPLTSSPTGYLNGYAYNVKSNTNGDNLSYDNVIAPGINPVLPAAQAGLALVGNYNGSLVTLSLSSMGSGPYALALQSDNTGISDPYLTGWSYVALENGTASATPTPIPAAAWLMGSGLIGLCGWRRQKI